MLTELHSNVLYDLFCPFGKYTCGFNAETLLKTRSSQEEATRQTSIDDAFDTVLEFMAHTTKQCKNLYRSVPAWECNQTEMNHVCRYHPPHVSSHGAAKPRVCRKPVQRTSEDFYIELAPGTYAITAGACDSKRQTRVVKVNAGESVDLSFTV
ncbi:A-kinase-interacting protein 1-like isoform X2 [Acipenser ruthenus]|uniref:A-kinase-interacting protein 1-like isoform X2 n=1 Tax=Acipenser ruthenus TaxID=7906 RepID=UPI002741CD0B|nr:A-kinase-interacting protein 1-like isoform X2 [Acipenser ruthenus]